MKSCPAPGCNADVQAHHFCCPRHWSGMPHVMRQRLTDAYYQLRHEDVSLGEVRRIESDVCRALRWNDDAATAERVSFHCCRRCWERCLSARLGDGPGGIVLSEVEAGSVPSSQAWHVVGFTARPRAGHRGSYTWFVEHKCGGITAAVEAARGGPPPVPFRGYA